MKTKWPCISCSVLLLAVTVVAGVVFAHYNLKQRKQGKIRENRLNWTSVYLFFAPVVVLTSLSFTDLMKEAALQKADQDKVGRLVVV